MKKNAESNLHIKFDDTLISLIHDYHGVSPSEILSYFGDLCRQMTNTDGNIANSEKKSVKTRTKRAGKFVNEWRTEKGNAGYDAYAFRGYYPNSKIPFKISGVKQGDDSAWACFVIAIGDKNKVSKLTNQAIEELNELVAESILLGKKPEDLSDKTYKIKPFKCMRPKGLPLLRKGDA